MPGNADGRSAGQERLVEWSARVSHDLKNPLTAVTMSLELAREEISAMDAPAGEGLLALIDRASRGAARLEATLDQLVAEARGETS